jgi:hypothetical protein
VQGLATGGANIMRRVSESQLVDELIDLVAREHDWLADKGAEAEIVAWERRLKPGALSRIVLSDRHLARWTVEAVTPDTPLIAAARDPDLVNRYLVGLLRTLDDLIVRKQVDAMFAYAVAGAPALAMVELAEMRGLPFFRVSGSRIDGQHTVERGAQQILESVRNLYRKALTDGRIVAGGMDRARKYLETFRAAPAQPDYHQLSGSRTRAALSWRAVNVATKDLRRQLTRRSDDVRNLRKPSPFGHWRSRITRPFRARMAQPLFQTPDLDALPGRCAFFPLHLDPEASTMVAAPMFTSQCRVIEALIKALPPDMTLLVKEHPSMQGLRPLRFYRRLRRLPRVRLISPATPSFALIRRSDFTCSITGTAAWEAMLFGKPALVLGAFPFSVIQQGLVTCNDFSRLPEAVGQTLQQEPATDHMLLTYLAAVYTAGFSFPAHQFWGRITPKLVADNPSVAENIAAQLLLRLREAHLVRANSFEEKVLI